LAQERIAEIVQSQGLRGRWVVADEAFGNDTGVLDGVAGWGRRYVAEVPPTTRVWRERPRHGGTCRAGRLVAGAPEVRTGLAVATARPPEAWSRQTIKAGSQGPMVAEFAAIRVLAVRDAWPGPDVWWVLRRHLETGAWQTSLCHAPWDITLATQVRRSGMRGPIDTGGEDGTQLLGMGDYAGRRWTGWHQHMTWVILAHFFVVRLSLRLNKSACGDVTSGGDGLDRCLAPT
jgi:SRSO17 transposase